MFCPRCGTANTETIKFCRQCGLSLAQISGFVASGGTSALVSPSPVQPPHAPIQLAETSEMLALKQKRILTILAMILLPAVAAIIGEEAFGVGEQLSVLFLLIPLGITWAIYHCKTQLRRLQEKQLQQHFMAAPMYGQIGQIGQAGQSGQVGQPLPIPQPLFQGQLTPPPTNPLNVASHVPGSVVEEETRRFSGKQ
jgi:hypothetical protein